MKNLPQKSDKRTWMLVSDIDGTLLGDEESLARFRAWITDERSGMYLVYATGRKYESVADLCAGEILPEPDFVIASVGTEIFAHPQGQPFGDWCAPPRRWSAAAIRDAVQAIAGVKLQPSEFQSSLKVSLYAKEFSPNLVASLRSALEKLALECEIIYSGGLYLDLLPRGVNKGSAVKYLSAFLSIPLSSIVACGDSENDASMFMEGICGVMVANAEMRLKARGLKGIYYSPHPFAAGVHDGVLQWRQQVLLAMGDARSGECGGFPRKETHD